MKRFHCDKETEIIEALRGGSFDAELVNHAAGCAICADTLAVSQCLLADERATPVLPDSDFLWWKAQLACKYTAVEQATQSIALVRKVSYAGVAAAGLWLVFARGHLQSAIAALSKHEIWPTTALSQTALFVGAGALLFTLLGSLYLAHPEK